MGSTYRLIMQSGPEVGMEYVLDKADLFLGRDISNDLVINDAEVSRKHARLVKEGSTYRIEDLGSTNGTFIRGQRLAAPLLLNPGETITLGEKIVLRFEVVSSDPNATVVAQRGAFQATQPPPRVAPAPSIPPAPSFSSVPSTPPVQPVSIPPAPAYQPIPAAPVYPPVAAPKKKSSKALIIVLVILGALVLLCVVPWIIIDATNSYCVLMPGILNMIFPGACP